MNWSKHVLEIKAFGLTQQQIAEQCQCRQTTISHIESGKTANPGWVLGQALLRLHTLLVAQDTAQKATA